MNAYGIGEVSDRIALWELRAAGAWQMGLAALLTLDPATAVGKSHFADAPARTPPRPPATHAGEPPPPAGTSRRPARPAGRPVRGAGA